MKTDSYIAKIQRVHVLPSRIDSRKYARTTCKPDKEHHGLQDEIALFIREFEMLRIMAEEVTEHVHHESH